MITAIDLDRYEGALMAFVLQTPMLVQIGFLESVEPPATSAASGLKQPSELQLGYFCADHRFSTSACLATEWF